MAQKRKYTKELLKAQAKGRQIVIASNLHDPNTRTGQVHVRYAPRYATDARPWVETYRSGDGVVRLSGRECTVEARYIIDTVEVGYHQVIDLHTDEVKGVFNHRASYREASMRANELNRQDRCEVMGLAKGHGA